MTDTSTTAITAFLDGLVRIDLIPRMHAIQSCQVGPSDEWSRATKGGYTLAATDCARNILKIEPHPFIAAARDLVPALLAERDALAAELAQVRAQHDLADLWKLSNELSWSPKTRDIADRIRAALTTKGDAK